jgi:hypothetical protein
MRSVFARVGWSQDTVTAWIKHTEQGQDLLHSPYHKMPTYHIEMAELKTKPLWRLRFAWGRRKSLDGGPSPLLSPKDNATTTQSKPPKPFPFYTVYETQQAALDQAKTRTIIDPATLPSLPTTD